MLIDLESIYTFCEFEQVQYIEFIDTFDCLLTQDNLDDSYLSNYGISFERKEDSSDYQLKIQSTDESLVD